jgi:hypothetical protein
VLILKICERTDALKYFGDAFGKPIADVFAQHLSELLESNQKTADDLTAPTQAVSVEANQETVCAAIISCLSVEEAKRKTVTETLIGELFHT